VCGLDSTVSGQGPVVGCCECGDEPSGACATQLVNFRHAWVTVGLFFNPGHHTGRIYIFIIFYLGACVAQLV
jgi:hypothetical protein